MTKDQSKPLTPDDLLKIPDGKHFELVNGKLVEKKHTVLSGYVVGTVLSVLGEFCGSHQAGLVFPHSLGICCFAAEPTKLRRPDVVFVKKGRFKRSFWDDNFLMIPPDLAVEVVSPNDLATDLLAKVEEYLTAGIPLVWVIYPGIATVLVYRADGTLTKLCASDELTGEAVIPGFKCKVADLFPATAP